MRVRPRWSRWALLGAIAAAVGVMPVAARPARESREPPLAVQVAYGDSLWTLAQTHADASRDVREVVATLREANAVSAADLQPGMIILIPAELLARNR